MIQGPRVAQVVSEMRRTGYSLHLKAGLALHQLMARMAKDAHSVQAQLQARTPQTLAQEDAWRSRIARSTGLGSLVSKSISLAQYGVIAMRAIRL
jgi:hypothetical protein